MAIENGPVEIVDFPIKNGDFPLPNVSSSEGTNFKIHGDDPSEMRFVTRLVILK